jgi:hypothetical protein
MRKVPLAEALRSSCDGVDGRAGGRGHTVMTSVTLTAGAESESHV